MRDARIKLEAAREWEAKGMFKPGAFAHLEQTLSPKAEEPSLAMQSFYAIGGVLLGAATAALYALLELNELISYREGVAWWFFLVSSVALLSIGWILHAGRQVELGDAVLLAGIVPTAILLGPEPAYDGLFAIPAMLAAAVLATRHKAHLVPLVALGLLCVAVPIFFFRVLDWDFFGSNDTATWFWLVSAVGIWAGVALWNRFARPKWDDEGAVVTTAALGIAWVATVFEVFDINTDGVSEVVIALGLGALIGAGVALKERGIIFTAGIGLTIDAIAFAFNIGGPTIGLLVLLLLAGALITTATLLRRRKAQTGASP